MIRLILFAFFSLEAKSTCITNFNKNLCANFQITPSVIIKTHLSKKQLREKLQVPVQQLAFLHESNLFLVKHNSPSSYSKKLREEDFIIYAQPDILQKRQNHLDKQLTIASRYHLNEIWKKTKGEGVKVAIIDDGFNLDHEDLKGLKLAFEYDVEQRQLNSSPKISHDKHGTQVAGIIFAQHNNKGIDGIAPNAELIAIRQTSSLTSHSILAFTVAHLAEADIINCSWKSSILLEPVYDVIIDIIKYGRKGKGTAIVFSAGNNAEEVLPYVTEASISEAIVVGATQAYSNYGKSVDFILPSGIKTTKQKGYGRFGGTSATASVMSGLIALKMSANKTLDTKEIINQLREELSGHKRKE